MASLTYILPCSGPQADADEDAGKGMSAPSLPADGAIQCPMCDRRFPVLQIERHAMYCNGSGEDTEEDAPGL